MVSEIITNSVGMRFVEIAAGTFTMGEPVKSDSHRLRYAFAAHRVTITKSFLLGMTPVTQQQYLRVMGKNPSLRVGVPGFRKDRSLHPVDTLSWFDAKAFCAKLSDLAEEKKFGRHYALPTNAQWEYACRAGSKTAYSFGESSRSLGDYAWFDENSDNQSHEVGKKKPNAWGLYDMLGNVNEWVEDEFNAYHGDRSFDPFEKLNENQSSRAKFFRGGWFGGGHDQCESASFGARFAEWKSRSVGMRVVCIYKPE